MHNLHDVLENLKKCPFESVYGVDVMDYLDDEDDVCLLAKQIDVDVSNNSLNVKYITLVWSDEDDINNVLSAIRYGFERFFL